MIKAFLVGLSILFGFTLFVMVHYISYERLVPLKKLESIVEMSNIVSPSLSVAYYEPRILFTQRASNPAYPQMAPLNKMEFIYAQ